MVPSALALALFSLAPPARAADEACFECCRAGGLSSCEARLRVFGEGAPVAREGAGWRVVGLWELGCDGVGAFDPGATVVLDHAPLGGELIMQALNPLQVHCFEQACALPESTCVTPADDLGRLFLLDCESDLPVDAATLSNVSPVTRSPGAKVVVIDGRPLVVLPVSGTAFAAGTSNGAHAPSRSGSPRIVPTGSSAPAMTAGPSSSPRPEPVAAAPSTAMPAAASMPSSDPMAALAASLPADPPTACKAPAEALRGEARKRVDAGDDRRIKRDALGALQEYRAALTMDACNAYAWNGIGDIANEAARPDLAVRALRNTTRLLPGHYGAWTMLGRNYEALRQSSLAAEAYSKALELRPGLPEALDGWRRTAAP
ncbi:MAG: hypothetical protein Q8P18_12535 [Pseudomonadota bacterium]|nr:hypothetical protein [Pseudomonadota bacterium]